MPPIRMTGGGEIWAFLAILVGIFVTIFWMYVGWHAMKAHERLADAVERLAGAARQGGTKES